jgi:hypothetical protein
VRSQFQQFGQGVRVKLVEIRHEIARIDKPNQRQVNALPVLPYS